MDFFQTLNLMIKDHKMYICQLVIFAVFSPIFSLYLFMNFVFWSWKSHEI